MNVNSERVFFRNRPKNKIYMAIVLNSFWSKSEFKNTLVVKLGIK